MFNITCVGAVYIDTILTVPEYPQEDQKTRARSLIRRRGGNCGNTLEVLTQLVYSSDAPPPSALSRLHLVSVAPDRNSEDFAFIRDSLPYVNQKWIERPRHNHAATSYIMRSIAANTRTIVSYNPLPEMTHSEFWTACTGRQNGKPSEGWYHFEGRIPEILLESVQKLRKSCPHLIKISVECEKPERAGVMDMARLADVVIFSQLWVMGNGYDNPSSFLVNIKDQMKDNALLCCTWGACGAVALQKRPQSEAELAVVLAWSPISGREVVDTIGAGDTFIAGMLYAVSRHPQDWSLSRKLTFANELAGRKVYQRGFTGLVEQMREAHADEPF